MRILTTTELQERQDLLDRLTFEVSTTNEIWRNLGNRLDDDYPSVKIWVIWRDESGCVYDGSDITYLFQNDFPIDFDPEIIEGYGGYSGNLNHKELEDMLLKIGFKPE